jgi:hypothetical protein
VLELMPIAAHPLMFITGVAAKEER